MLRLGGNPCHHFVLYLGIYQLSASHPGIHLDQENKEEVRFNYAPFGPNWRRALRRTHRSIAQDARRRLLVDHPLVLDTFIG